MVGANIKQYRQRANMLQADLARHLGVNQRTISDYERGRLEPNLTNLQAMARLFGVTLDELVNGDNHTSNMVG